jgi:hypothetical protein
MTTLQLEFNQIVDRFKNQIEEFKITNNLDKGNIFIEIHPELDDIGGMKDGDGNRIPDVGFLTEVKFILAENY